MPVTPPNAVRWRPFNDRYGLSITERSKLRYLEIIEKGDKNGKGTIVKFRLPSGLEIVGLPTQNFYGGGWDLGPTWNYLVMADKPFLVDTGRYGQGARLISMMKAAGIDPTILDFVLITHGHEDHDGGLAELVGLTRLKVKAHAIYDRLIRQYPQDAPNTVKTCFPAKCWHCFMPETFYRENCLEYHRVLANLKVDCIRNGDSSLAPDIQTVHLPGHSPDALVVFLGNEAVIVGDTVLPDISPWPTRVRAAGADVGTVVCLPADRMGRFNLDPAFRSQRGLLGAN